MAQAYPRGVWFGPSVSALRAKCAPEVLERVTRECAISTLPSTFGSGEAELVALASGLKPLVRQELDDAALQAQRERVAAAGLRLTVGATSGAKTRVFLSRDEAPAREAIAAEAHNDDAAMGRLLGYPTCCVEAFTAMPEHWLPRQRWFRRRTNLALAQAAAARTKTFHGRLNSVDFHLFHYVAWTPCAYDCAPSLAYANAVALELSRRPHGWLGPLEEHGAAAFVARADALLSARRLVWREAQVSFTVNAGGQVLEAWPTSRDHPRRVISREQLEREVVLAAHLLSTRTPPRGALLYPFA